MSGSPTVAADVRRYHSCHSKGRILGNYIAAIQKLAEDEIVKDGEAKGYYDALVDNARNLALRLGWIR